MFDKNCFWDNPFNCEIYTCIRILPAATSSYWRSGSPVPSDYTNRFSTVPQSQVGVAGVFAKRREGIRWEGDYKRGGGRDKVDQNTVGTGWRSAPIIWRENNLKTTLKCRWNSRNKLKTVTSRFIIKPAWTGPRPKLTSLTWSKFAIKCMNQNRFL
jgi:hypothetical protein